MKFAWKEGARIRADVSRVKAELDEIGEELEAEDVVVFAGKHKKSELHKCFELDDKVAGHQYRLSQARYIIRSIVIVSDPSSPIEVAATVIPSKEKAEIPEHRAFEHVRAGTETGYHRIANVLNNEEMLFQVLRQITDAITALEKKARTYAFLKSLLLDSVTEKLTVLRKELEEGSRDYASGAWDHGTCEHSSTTQC